MRLLGFLILLCVLVLMISPRAREAARRRLPQLLIYGGGALLIVLAVGGRLPWLAAVVGGAAAMALRLLPLALQLPMLAQLWRRWRGEPEPERHADAAPRHGRMSVREARDVLGVGQAASREEITAAHRRLIQRLHPDRGGSAGLAARINEARETLLGRRSAA